MVKSICYYISDQGYGHAARSIAVIRSLLNMFSDIHIYVKAFTAYNFLANSLLDSRVTVIRQRNDVGVVINKFPFDVIHNESLKLVKSWMLNWPDYVKKEKEFCRTHSICLIITDVAPQPLEVASQLGIPSALISNFTWQNIYEPLFGNELREELTLMKQVYSKADVALVLPFEHEVTAKKVVPVCLVAKTITKNREEMRKALKVGKDEFLIYFGMGFSMPDGIISTLNLPENVKVITSSNIALSGKQIIKIPLNETEGQNYIAMCDLVVIKSGYTTTAEAISSKVPLLITRRGGFSEDILLCSRVIELGVGREISNREFVGGEWLLSGRKKAKPLKQNYTNLPERFKNNGIPKIMGELQMLLAKGTNAK